jgi:hypothetical protein
MARLVPEEGSAEAFKTAHGFGWFGTCQSCDTKGYLRRSLGYQRDILLRDTRPSMFTVVDATGTTHPCPRDVADIVVAELVKAKDSTSLLDVLHVLNTNPGIFDAQKAAIPAQSITMEGGRRTTLHAQLRSTINQVLCGLLEDALEQPTKPTRAGLAEDARAAAASSSAGGAASAPVVRRGGAGGGAAPSVAAASSSAGGGARAEAVYTLPAGYDSGFVKITDTRIINDLFHNAGGYRRYSFTDAGGVTRIGNLLGPLAANRYGFARGTSIIEVNSEYYAGPAGQAVQAVQAHPAAAAAAAAAAAPPAEDEDPKPPSRKRRRKRTRRATSRKNRNRK